MKPEIYIRYPFWWPPVSRDHMPGTTVVRMSGCQMHREFFTLQTVPCSSLTRPSSTLLPTCEMCLLPLSPADHQGLYIGHRVGAPHISMETFSMSDAQGSRRLMRGQACHRRRLSCFKGYTHKYCDTTQLKEDRR